MADTVHHASLPLQTATLTFTKSQGHHGPPGLQEHTAGQGSGSLAASRQPPVHSPAASQEGENSQWGNSQCLAFCHGDLG